ncbi:dihydropteroate synthase, partial [Candidatus Peregrinibacteria bacterium]|nr:dihydropteroate synthase [Candidatus Peregrinibacteria bacterium]
MKETQVMAVVNVTPDSFSDGGRFDSEDLVEVAKQMVLDGATILDIGG